MLRNETKVLVISRVTIKIIINYIQNIYFIRKKYKKDNYKKKYLKKYLTRFKN